MTLIRTSEEIDAIIARRASAGSKAYDIADRLDLPVVDVRERMLALGFGDDREGHLNKYSVHPMWSADGYERRMAIWQRQRDGARRALRGRT